MKFKPQALDILGIKYCNAGGSCKPSYRCNIGILLHKHFDGGCILSLVSLPPFNQECESELEFSGFIVGLVYCIKDIDKV